MYDNFIKEHRTLILKKKVWNIAKAYVKSDYKIAYKELAKLSLDGLQWLKNIPKETWTRGHFRDSSIYDLLHNVSECFNSFCLEVRDQPIITCLEILHRQLMIRLEKKRECIRNCTTSITPSILKKL